MFLKNLKEDLKWIYLKFFVILNKNSLTNIRHFLKANKSTSIVKRLLQAIYW
jgi:hypothetical protein